MPATAPPTSSAAPDAAIREAMDCLEWGRHDEAILISEALLREDP